MINPADLLNATEVAAELGLRHREAIATYRRRYPEFPVPLIDKGTCVLWHRLAVLEWDEWRRMTQARRGPLVWCERTADGLWSMSTAGLPTVAKVEPAASFADVENAVRRAIASAFAPEQYEPEFRLGQPVLECVYCGGTIERTGMASAANAPLRASGVCCACGQGYRSAGLIAWTLR